VLRSKREHCGRPTVLGDSEGAFVGGGSSASDRHAPAVHGIRFAPKATQLLRPHYSQGAPLRSVGGCARSDRHSTVTSPIERKSFSPCWLTRSRSFRRACPFNTNSNFEPGKWSASVGSAQPNCRDSGGGPPTS